VLTTQVKLLPTPEQELLLLQTMQEYIALVNDIVDYAIAIDKIPKLSSASIHAPLPAALRDQCRLDAKSIWTKTRKHGWTFPTLRKPAATWNNQNYSIADNKIGFPVWQNGRSCKIWVKAIIPAEHKAILENHKLGTLRITRKSGKFIAQIAYEEHCAEAQIGGTMGVDLGILCPAVSVTDTGKTRFYGNGRQNKYVRRRYKQKRKKLGKAKKLNAIRKINNKEQRWMRDQDHKISRAIVNEAIAQGVAIIKLETLSGIRSTARTSRKNNYSLQSWSFYRLATYIEYKAKLAGIEIQYVDPRYTSQTCPICGHRHKPRNRRYKCRVCGYVTHRDRVGAVNICRAA